MTVKLRQLHHVDFLDAWEKIGPFGCDYAAPIFLVKDVYVRQISTFGHNHVRLKISSAEEPSILYSAICFRIADKPSGRFLLSLPKERLDMLFTLQMSKKWGRRFPNFVIEDFRCH